MAITTNSSLYNCWKWLIAHHLHTVLRNEGRKQCKSLSAQHGMRHVSASVPSSSRVHSNSALLSRSNYKAFLLSKALSDSIPFPLMPLPLSCAYNTLLIILHSPFTPNIMNDIHYDYDMFLCCFWLCFHLQLWLPFVSDSPLFLTLLTFWLHLPSDSTFPVLFYLYIRLRANVLIPLEWLLIVLVLS